MPRRRRNAPGMDMDVTGFLSILSIVTGLICLILFIIALPIAMNPDALKIVSFGLWSGSRGNIEDPRVPSYIDCFPDGVMLYPGQTWVEQPRLQQPGNPVERLLGHVEQHSDEEYVVVMVRPRSVKCYRRIRSLIAARRNVAVGYDAVDADFKVNWDEAMNALNLVKD